MRQLVWFVSRYVVLKVNGVIGFCDIKLLIGLRKKVNYSVNSIGPWLAENVIYLVLMNGSVIILKWSCFFDSHSKTAPLPHHNLPFFSYLEQVATISRLEQPWVLPGKEMWLT